MLSYTVLGLRNVEKFRNVPNIGYVPKSPRKVCEFWRK